MQHQVQDSSDDGALVIEIYHGVEEKQMGSNERRVDRATCCDPICSSSDYGGCG